MLARRWATQSSNAPITEPCLSHAPFLQTTGFTGADLANLVNEAALLAGRGNKGALFSAFCCQKDELSGLLACQGAGFLEGRACARDRALLAAEGAARRVRCAQQLQSRPPCLPSVLGYSAMLCLAGIVTNADFDSAILRAVAGIEKKRSVLQARCWDLHLYGMVCTVF